MIAELKAFLMKGNVVDLAVAVVIGAAFGAVVTAFVNNIINPIIAAVFGQPDISGVLAIDLGDSELLIGAFLQQVLNFVIIGTVLFFVVKAYNTLEMRRAKGEVEPEEEPAPSEEVILLTQIRDSLAR